MLLTCLILAPKRLITLLFGLCMNLSPTQQSGNTCVQLHLFGQNEQRHDFRMELNTYPHVLTSAGSVSVSGHKFIGCPMPCGVQITRKEHMRKMSQDIEYLASKDATIMGSRNGHAAVYMWYTLNRKGYVGM